jgi:tetratricopeptide (TPR) repeat protein
MSKRKARHGDSRLPLPKDAAHVLTDRPTVAGLIWLLAIVFVIGVSGGYLAWRFSAPGATAPATGVDTGEAWRARLARNPDDLEAMLGLAHADLDAGRADEAERLYRQVLAKEPTNVEAVEHLGNVMLLRGQTEAALRQYDAALRLKPHYAHALWDKAHALQEVKKDYPAAILAWETFIGLVGADSRDGKTAKEFVADARQALRGSRVEKAFDGK